MRRRTSWSWTRRSRSASSRRSTSRPRSPAHALRSNYSLPASPDPRTLPSNVLRLPANGVSRSARGAARSGLEPVALARQVDPDHSARDRPRVPVDCLRRPDDHRRLRDPLHGAVSARYLRLQRRRPALGVARQLLLVCGARDRPVSALHPRPCAGLSGDAGDSVSRTAVALARAREVVAARDPALPPRRDLPGRRSAGAARPLLGRSGCPARPLRRRRAPVHDPLSARNLRLRARPRPLGAARRRVCRTDARRVPTLPPGPGRARAGRSRGLMRTTYAVAWQEANGPVREGRLELQEGALRIDSANAVCELRYG